MSVSATDDPLYADQGAAFFPVSPIRGLEFFDQFTDHAAKSNAQKREVLDELLSHEDDPLYWVNDLSKPASSDLDTFEADIELSRSFRSPVPPIPEEPSSPVLQGEGSVSDRCVNRFSEPNTA